MTSGSPGPSGGRAGRLVTVSAAYGAGGSVVAPALARRLGVPFLQRVTTTTGQAAQPGPHRERLSSAEAKNTPVHRMLAAFTQAMPAGPTQSPHSTRHQDDLHRSSAEAEIHAFLAAGEGVILGRAAAVVLGKDRGFHVRLDGPAAGRIVQGAAIEGISEDEATTHQCAADKARTAYVRRLYRADPTDPALYHLVIDSTAMPLDTVIELVLTAVRAQITTPAASRPGPAADGAGPA